ncbi:PepSY domain-containing protein [Thalassotalea aquiviva]|uniref:PepSY domain-containing protein n=1 Tax=Thalassotalea aquiviva TaxID=3242415 RepID=UPI00352B148C
MKRLNNNNNIAKKSRNLHKWLMAFFGLQFMMWSVTGAYMVYLNIHFIHGDTLVKNQQITIDRAQINLPFQRLYQNYPNISNLSLSTILDKAVYQFESNGEKFLIDASTGEQLPWLNKEQAIRIAQQEFTGNSQVKQAQLLQTVAPDELSPRHLPAWRVDFDHWMAPTLYVSQTSGKVVTKRHSFWRLFDWMFRIHVMDYKDSEVDNTLLLSFTVSGLFATLCGLVLTYTRTIKPRLSKLVGGAR